MLLQVVLTITSVASFASDLYFYLQGSVPVARAQRSKAADPAAGRHVLPDGHHCRVFRLLHARPRRPLHHVLLPRGHHHSLGHRSQGDDLQ